MSQLTLEDHIEDVRRALWARPGGGNACVMVGSGFSRNADPKQAGAAKFPLWSELAKEMAAVLSGTGDRLDPLRLAQAYEGKFKPKGLRDFFEKHIPDSDYLPGELHRRLLALPWADVYTTNYDTLLERASVAARRRNYSCILEEKDLLGKSQPRVVKLHGTLGGTSTLISTTEDYRRYKDDHPLLVNLTRQALVESVFLLVGFNGEDPNFQQLAGWVRDALGDEKPRIYWCGLDPTETDKHIFESAGIVPLDLAPVAAAGLPDERHRLALEWVIGTLELGPSGDFKWAPRQTEKTNTRFTAFSEYPVAGWQALDAGKIKALTEIWRLQRREYPGWHLAPDEVRERLWDTTYLWRDPIFKRAAALAPVERLLVIRELYWRLESCLSPVFTFETDSVIGWLECVNPFGKQLHLPNAVLPEKEQIAASAEAWISLAQSVLHTAREDLDHSRFELWRDRLQIVAAAHVNVIGELRHEIVLRELQRLDLASFRDHLDRWRKTAVTSLELARIAAYLAELGIKDGAIDFANRAIDSLSKQTPAMLWLEAWCTFLLSMLHWRNSSERAKCDDALEYLKAQGYNPWTTIEAQRELMKRSVDWRSKEVSYKAKFDGGAVQKSIHMGRSDSPELRGYQLARLLENAPCPTHTPELSIMAEAAAGAAIRINDAAPRWSLALLLRAGASAEILDERFDRLTIALMDQSEVEHAAAVLLPLIRCEIERLPDKIDPMGRRMLITAWEVLSRLALRIQGDHLDALLQETIEWLVKPEIIAQHALTNSLAVLLKRVIEALPDASIHTAAQSFVSLPIYGEPGYAPQAHEQSWPEPFDYIWRRGVAAGSVASISDQAWRRLVDAMRADDPAMRRRAFIRAHFFNLHTWLTAIQEKEFDEAVWSKINGKNGLPYLAGFRASVILNLPHSMERGARALLKEVTVKQVPEPCRDEAGAVNLGQLADNRAWLEGLLHLFKHEVLAHRDDPRLQLENDEAVDLTKRVLQWWETAGAVLSDQSLRKVGLAHSDVNGAVDSFCALFGEALFLRVPRGDVIVTDVISVIKKLDELGFPTLRTIPGRLFQGIDSVATVSAMLQHGLVSSDERTLRSASRALLCWYRGGKAGLIPELPLTILELAVSRVCFQCQPCLDHLISVVAKIVEAKGCPGTLVDRLLIGLDEIAEATEPARLRRHFLRGEIERTEVVEHLHIRSWSALLAHKLADLFTSTARPIPGALDRWAKIRSESTLPEIRRA